MKTKGKLAVSASFEYLCYGATVIIFFNYLSAGTSDSDV